MGKLKILYTVYIAVLSFHVRESQSRSLNDDELEHKITKKAGNVEDFTRKCFCFPQTARGIPASKFIPVNDDQERLVVYLYKSRNSEELTSFIPSWEKQISFPNLTYEIGDRLETVAPDGIINVFDTTKVSEYIENPVVTDEQFDVTVKPGVPNLEILSVPISDNQYKHYSGVSLNNINTEILPPAESLLLPDTDSKIINGVNQYSYLSPLVGKKQQPVNGHFIDYSEEPNEPENQNQQTLSILDDINTHTLLGNPQQKGETISIEWPKFSSQLPSDQNQNQNLDISPLEHQSQLIESIPHVFNNLNMPMVGPHDSRKRVKNVLPGIGDLIPPSNIIINPSGIHLKSPNKQIKSIGYSPSKYENPKFDEWYKEQIKSLRSKRPLIFNALTVHSLKLLLMKALNENGIYLSKDGDLVDSNGNILKMTNLKLRSIILSDPMDYNALMSAKNCVTPYDLAHLEAVLLTLIFPPRILSIIPLGLKNVFFSTSPSIISPLCSQSNCNIHESFRSGSPEKDDITSDVNYTVEDNDENLHITEENPNQIVEEVEPIFTQDIKPGNDHSYMAANNDLPLEKSPVSKSDSRNNLLTQTVSNPENFGGEIFKRRILIPKGTTITCHNNDCQIIGSRSVAPINTGNNIYIDGRAAIEKGKSLDSNDIVNNDDDPYVSFKNDLLQNAKGDQSDLYLTLASRNDPGWPEPIDTGNTIYIDGRAAIEEGKSLDSNDIVNNDDDPFVAFKNDLLQNAKRDQSDLYLTLASRNDPGWPEPIDTGNTIYIDGRAAIKEGKSLDSNDIVNNDDDPYVAFKNDLLQNAKGDQSDLYLSLTSRNDPGWPEPIDTGNTIYIDGRAAIKEGKSLDSNDIVNNDDDPYVAFKNDLLQNAKGDQSDLYLSLTSRNDPGWPEPIDTGNTIYIDGRAAIKEGKSLDSNDIVNNDDDPYVAFKNDLLQNAKGDQSDLYLSLTSRNDPGWPEPIDTGNTIYIDGRAAIEQRKSLDSNDIVNNDDDPFVAFKNDLLQNAKGDQSDLYLTLASRNDPGWPEPIDTGNTIYIDGRAAIEEGKSLEDVDFPQETPKKLGEEDYEALMIRIVGGNAATSSGTPVSNKGRSGFDF